MFLFLTRTKIIKGEKIGIVIGCVSSIRDLYFTFSLIYKYCTSILLLRNEVKNEDDDKRHNDTCLMNWRDSE